MITGLALIPVTEFVRRILERSGTGNWFVLVAPPDAVPQLVQQISAGITGETAEAVTRLDRPASADEVVKAAARNAVLVVSGLDSWSAAQWERWDVVRSRLVAARKVALVLTAPAAALLFTQAPHFARFFTGSAWQAELDADTMSEASRLARIVALEHATGMTSAEMAQKAERRELSADPQFAEWLALIGRSELL